MSERRTPRTSPDTEPPKSPFHIEGLPPAMQLKAIDQLRTAQFDYEERLIDEGKDSAEAPAHFDQMIEDHLKANGVAKGDPKFEEYAARLRGYSVDKIPAGVWEIGPVDDDGTVNPSPRLEAWTDLAGKYGTPLATDPSKDKDPDPVTDPNLDPTKTTDPTVTTPADPTKTGTDTDPLDPSKAGTPAETKPGEGDKDKPKTPEAIKALVDADPEIIAARGNLDKLRSRLAELSAKRQGRLFNRKKLKEEYDEVHDQYQAQLNALTKLELAAEKAAGYERTELEERLDAAFKITTQFRDLQQESVDIMTNSKVGRFVSWMTKGGTVKRVLKGMALGAGAAVVATGLAALFVGTAGVGFGAAAAGLVTLGSRFTRGFASFDNRQGRGMNVMDVNNANDLSNLDAMNQAGAVGASGEETADRVQKYMTDKLEADTRKEQNKRRKSTAFAIGAVALGAGLVEGANLVADHYTGYAGKLHDGVFGADNANAKPGGPPTPDTPPPPAVVEHLYNADALTIRPGEGWYETFKAMDIPQKDWSPLLEKVGPELHNMQVDGHPLAYQMSNGQWGIRMTPDGTMPKEALNLINTTHDQMTGVRVPAAVEAPAQPPVVPAEASRGGTTGASFNPETLMAPVDHASIENVIEKPLINPSDITGNATLDGLRHVAPWYPPDMIAQKLGIRAPDWERLEDYIAQQVTQERNPLYRGTFEVTPAGYLRFSTDTIPASTMADMINQIPQGARTR